MAIMVAYLYSVRMGIFRMWVPYLVVTTWTIDTLPSVAPPKSPFIISSYTLSEARSGVDWADLMAAQGAFGIDFYDKSTRTIVGTML